MFGNDLSQVNLVGLVVCLLGISLHVVHKASSAPNIPAKENSHCRTSGRNVWSQPVSGEPGGPVVCLLGISLHVVCKSASAPSIPAKQNSRYFS
jgi:hypothetical protein